MELAAGFGVAIALAAVLALVPACTTSKTDARGPAASATHQTPGVTRLRVRVRPGGGGEGTEAPRHQGTEGDAGAGRAGGAGSSSSAGAPWPLVVALAALGQTDAGWKARPPVEGPPIESEIPAVLREAVEAARASGFEVELEYEHTTEGVSTYTETPAELRTSSDEAALGFSTKLRRFRLPWGGEARGGGFGFEATLLGGHGVNALHVIGAGVMALAVIPLLRTPRRWTAAAVFAGAGLAIVMTGTLVDEYPWITLAAAVALLGVLGYGAYEAWRRGRVTLALDTITPVVERHPMGEQLKGLIGTSAGKAKDAVKAETSASKKRARV